MTTRPRRPRGPTPEDRVLWESVSRTVKPLARRPDADAGGAAPPAAGTRPSVGTKAPAGAAATPTGKRPAEPPRLAPLDRRLRARIAKGTVAIDGRVDLHGLTQMAAHHRLRAFLAARQAAGAKLVLVITGKGQGGDALPLGEERGVLRRMVPMWLASAELRPYVVGYEAAGRAHGGEGALYVRIRSRRLDA